ncbi:MAG: (Fe-S)-binding protein [Candidatus Binatia bacterium]
MSFQTEPDKIVRGAFNRLNQAVPELYLDCVHCGFCLPTCPTYVILGNEMDSPRGRIHLIRSASEGRIGITDNFVKHMDLCLLCRNCETVCPSGVKFGFLMEAARGQVQRHYEYSPADRWFRDFILYTFTDVDRLSVMSGLLRFYQGSGLQKLVRGSGILTLFGRLGKMEALLPSVPDQRLRKELPEVMPAKGKKRGRAGFLIGCVQRFFFPHVNGATARVLSENGYEVVMPKGQGCCGSFFVHEGERERGKKLARKTIDAFDQAGVDFIVVNAAGCGSVMKEYWELLRSDPAYGKKAEAFSKKVRDVSQVLAEVPFAAQLKKLNLVVTYHDACHLAHGQRIRHEPRAILKAIPGVRFVELKESDFCCGSAGVYNLLHPDLAQQFLDRKIERIKETGAQVVVSGNPGCSLQIEKGLKAQGLKIRVVHPAELLDWSYRGMEPNDV